MRPSQNAGTLALVGLISLALTACSQNSTPPPSKAELTSEQVANPCDFPTAPAATLEETAWQLFVAATCPTNGSPPLAFEGWTEQSCLQNPGSCLREAPPEQRRLHGSHLLAGLASGIPASECSPMINAQNAPASLAKFVPTNLAQNATFCEEVFVNGPEVAYIQQPAPGQSLLTLSQQAAYVKSGAKISFPKTAVEVKADWLPAGSLSPRGFDCSNPTLDIYTEMINGTCYALTGLHISSKLFPNWLWATFEPQFTATNPNRCKSDLYSSCSDPWGSNPAKSSGLRTQITQALDALMSQAKLAPAFRNYRLTGVQNNFVNSNTTLLGNSFTEFNAGVPVQQASCITCHSYAQLDSSKTPPKENPNFGPYPGAPATGQPQPPGPTWRSQDFSWLLGVLPEAPIPRPGQEDS